MSAVGVFDGLLQVKSFVYKAFGFVGSLSREVDVGDVAVRGADALVVLQLLIDVEPGECVVEGIVVHSYALIARR